MNKIHRNCPSTLFAYVPKPMFAVTLEHMTELFYVFAFQDNGALRKQNVIMLSASSNCYFVYHFVVYMKEVFDKFLL